MTVYCSVCTRISGEKVRISDETERVQSVSYPHQEHCRGYIYNVIVSSANWRNWWNKVYDCF